MGWEIRNRNYYYYRKRRDGPTVVSEYFGTGSIAELIAQEDAYERAYERMKREEEKCLIEGDLEIDRELDKIGDLVRALTYSVLLGRGYHTHKGQWRKKRDGK